MNDLFVMDDTGSPGNQSESQMLKSDRITYLAVYISKDIRLDLEKELTKLFNTLSPPQNPWDEFHFNEIVNRRGKFKGLESSEVLNIISKFSKILSKYNLPFLNQTITPRTLEENGFVNSKNKTLDEISIDFLFARIKIFILDNKLDKSIDFICDNGKLGKDGEKINIPILNNIVTVNKLSFEDSKKNILIQVADFFAYALNRNQMLMIKDKVSEFDKKIITLFNSALNKNAVSGTIAEKTTENTFDKKEYDKKQIEYWKKTGSYEYWKNVNKK